MTPDTAEIEAIRRLVNRNGEAGAARLLDITITTLARAAAGFRLRAATHGALMARLVELRALPEGASR